MFRKLPTLFLLLTFACFPMQSAWSSLTIDITLWLDDATPIAIVPFQWRGIGTEPIHMTEVISGDLRRSGKFAPMDEKDIVEHPAEASEVNYASWRNNKMKYLVVGKLRLSGRDSYEVQFQLLDVEKGSQILGHSFQANQGQLRRLSHHISDLIYEAITGGRGAFDTYLAYITLAKNRKGQSLYQLAISDSDGINEQILFESNMPIVRPAWSPDGKQLAYVSYSSGRPQIYVQNIFTKQTTQLTNFRGSNLSPTWSPDGRRMAMALSKDGNSEIYVMDLLTRNLTRITRNTGTDVEPAWFPDGRSLVFMSDRGGRPQLYRISVGERGPIGRAERLTYEGKDNMRPSVSPDGKRVAMVHNNDGNYRVAIMDLETEQLSVLTDGRLDETPSFAPNGSMLIYASQAGGKGVLAAVSADGRSSHKFHFSQGDVREPAWSPYKAN